MRKLLTFSISLIAAVAIQAQQVVRMEYFIDTDPGYGKGQSISNTQVGDNQLTFDFGNALPGVHVLSVRFQDSDGHWSTTMSRTFQILDKAEAQEPVRIEYFLDSDPGHGKGRTLGDIRVGDNDLELDLADAQPGVHVLSLRSQDAARRWSQTLSRTIYVVEPAGEVSDVEYFFDTDPGYGKGTAVSLPADLSAPFAFEVPVDDLSVGKHSFCVRVKSTTGKWSVLRTAVVEITNQSGIDGVTIGGKTVRIYDLQGRQIGSDASLLDGKPKGIYIINGKKTVK